jgi:hypothetical protein
MAAITPKKIAINTYCTNMIRSSTGRTVRAARRPDRFDASPQEYRFAGARAVTRVREAGGWKRRTSP